MLLDSIFILAFQWKKVDTGHSSPWLNKALKHGDRREDLWFVGLGVFLWVFFFCLVGFFFVYFVVSGGGLGFL